MDVFTAILTFLFSDVPVLSLEATPSIKMTFI